MMNLEQARAIIARPGLQWVDDQGNAVQPVEGQRFVAVYVNEEAIDPVVEFGSIVEYVGEGRVIDDNYDDEDKTDYSPGGQWCDFLVLQA